MGGMSEAVITVKNDPDRNAKGQWTKGNSRAISVHPEKNPRVMQAKSVESRKKNSTLAARQAILEEMQAINPDIQTFEEGWGLLTGNMSVHYLESDSLRDKVLAYKALAQATDAFEDKNKTISKVNVLAIGNDMAGDVLGMIGFDNKGNYQNHETIAAEVVEIEPNENDNE